MQCAAALRHLKTWAVKKHFPASTCILLTPGDINKVQLPLLLALAVLLMLARFVLRVELLATFTASVLPLLWIVCHQNHLLPINHSPWVTPISIK
jgi:hypothetical protein